MTDSQGQNILDEVKQWMDKTGYPSSPVMKRESGVSNPGPN